MVTLYVNMTTIDGKSQNTTFWVVFKQCWKNRENNGFTPLTTLISREKFIMTKSRKKNMEFWKISTKPGNLFEVSAGECLKPGLLCSTAVGASPLTRRRRWTRWTPWYTPSRTGISSMGNNCYEAVQLTVHNNHNFESQKLTPKT